MPVRLILMLFFWLLPGLAHSGPHSGPVTVFAAASLKTALDDIADLYFEATGQIVQVSYAASSALARQIQYGAPADIFISANVGWMDLLQSDGLLRDGSRFDLLSNQLVLIAGPDTTIQLHISNGFDLAGALGQSWLAMALLNAVPAGIYGKSALVSLGVWDDIKPRVAQSDNVRAALRLVATGEAPLGIVYASDAIAENRVRIVDYFPADSHPPILYPVAILRESGVGNRFLTFLAGDDARRVFDKNGFGRADAP